ncbi:putative transporter, Major facilitator superfamily MFS_1 [Thiomonas sp. X19]|uniref:oxalate/formate MFS antiporter n=1 Tax=Thiomonas sp. X19 TaxID=1050370 RepID=UPI000B64D170|nr:oxalate/formate MFS antiporter [Thiomonas sp. X19]SCC94082.1 putative transporter, Major facilitator superfamily MFS_1 [Thiomonas sp. X19]
MRLENGGGYSNVAGRQHNRWFQLILAIVCMGLVANLQYAWTLFVSPIHTKYHWSIADIQVAFSIFVLTETWLVPLEGWLVDRFGPRPVVAFGAICVGLAWVLNSYAASLHALYFAAVVAGIGVGCVYGTSVGIALKWFPDRRGLAAGLAAAGFGAGAAVTVIPIANMIHAAGYEHAFFFFGTLQGIAIFVLAMLMVRPQPPQGAMAAKAVLISRENYTPGQMVRTPVFWMMYACFVAVAAGGLIATAQIGPIAKDYGFAKMPIALFGLTLPLLTMTLAIDNLANGFTRPLSGFISDKIGRENTMLIIFFGEGLALLGLMEFGHNPYAFMVLAPVIFLCWGEIFSIFPALNADTFGSKYATTNAGILYTAKGTASLLVPLASVLAATSSWNAVFIVAGLASIIAALAAKLVLAPMRRRWIGRRAESASEDARHFRDLPLQAGE